MVFHSHMENVPPKKSQIPFIFRKQSPGVPDAPRFPNNTHFYLFNLCWKCFGRTVQYLGIILGLAILIGDFLWLKTLSIG